MSNPRTPEPDEDDDLTPLGFADRPPEPREAPPMRRDKYAGYDDPGDDEGDDRPTRPGRRKRHKFAGDNDPRGEPAPPPEEHYLMRPKPWWFWPLLLGGVGLFLVLVIGVVVVFQAGPVVGGIFTAASVVGILVETVAVAGLLMLVGTLFGISYGEVKEALSKLFGIVAFLNGLFAALSFAGWSCGGIGGVILAGCVVTLATYALFQTMFQLTVYETMITVGALDFCVYAANIGAGLLLFLWLFSKA